MGCVSRYKSAAIGSLLAASFIFGGCATLNGDKAEKQGHETAQAAVHELDSNSEDDIRRKYKMITYGQALPLVCQSESLAEGAIKNRPNLQIMWENYLYDRPEGIWGEIGGMVEVNGNLPLDGGRWTNACTVRLSYMLNQAGVKIDNDGRKTVSGGKGNQYYYRVRDLEKFLLRTFGPPQLAIVDGSANSFSLPNKPGIVLMDFPGSTFSGHVTIWNGAGSVDNADIGGFRLLFWELPCFMPEGRNEDEDVAALNVLEKRGGTKLVALGQKGDVLP